MNIPAEGQRHDAVRWDPWVGLIEVSPIGETFLDQASRAFVWAAVAAQDTDHFLARVRAAASEMSLRIESAEDIVPAARSLRARRNREVRRLVRRARLQSTEVAWGRFHAYEDDD
jgi:hypothetical protein